MPSLEAAAVSDPCALLAHGNQHSVLDTTSYNYRYRTGLLERDPLPTTILGITFI